MGYFADTNVYGRVSVNPAVATQWAKARRTLEKEGHRYLVCPLVLNELIAGLAKPEPAYFNKDIERFRLLEPAMDYMEFPGAFVLRTVLNCASPVAKFDKRHFKQWLKTILKARDRAELVQGRVSLELSELLTFGLDPVVVADQQQAGRVNHIQCWETQRDRAVPPPAREEWVALLLFGQGIIYQTEDIGKLTIALDAAYEYDSFLWENITHYNFGSDRNAGDWIDSQLLYYLADQEMHIITADDRLRSRVVKSKQVVRIHSLDEF